jgi:hypothetical protein
VIVVANWRTGDRLSTFGIDLGEGNVSSVCLSPDQRHVVIAGSSGEAFVGDTDDGSTTTLPTGIRGGKSVGWTSPSQLAYIIDIKDETFIQTYDVTTGETHNVATLHSNVECIFTTSGSMCSP